MGARLLILVIVAGGLAVYFAVQPAKQAAGGDSEGEDILVLHGEGQADVDVVKATVAEQPIGGTEPSVEPEFIIQLEVDRTGGRSRLVVNLSEKHGFYADTFDIEVWRKGPNVTGPMDSPHSFIIHINNFLRANSTFRTCADVMPSELDRFGGDIGTPADWDFQLLRFGRVREKDPDPLPRVSPLAKSVCE